MLKLAFACAKLSLITGGFLAVFTGLHFVALEYLVPKPEIEVNISDLKAMTKDMQVRGKAESKTIKVGERLQIKLQEDANIRWHAVWTESNLGKLEDSSKSRYKVFEFEAKKAGVDNFIFVCIGLGNKVVGYYKLDLTVEQNERPREN